MKVTNVFVFSDDTIFVEYQDVSYKITKGKDYVEKVYIEPITGREIRPLESIRHCKEAFYKQILRGLRTENVRRQLEKMPLDTCTPVEIGTITRHVTISGDIKKHADKLAKGIVRQVERREDMDNWEDYLL